MTTEGNKNTKQPSELKIRVKIQQILQDNMRQPIGMFHGKELSEKSFVNDLFKKLNITLKEDEK